MSSFIRNLQKIIPYITALILLLSISSIFEFLLFDIIKLKISPNGYIYRSIGTGMGVIAALLVGVRLEKLNKKKFLKIISLISIIFYGFAAFGSYDNDFVFFPAATAVIVTIISFLIIRDKASNRKILRE